MAEQAEFSEYIVFVDESGDHGLSSIDEQFPVFSLAFCMMEKSEYISRIVPGFQEFKFTFWGNDSVILHEHEIRKSKGPFSILMTNRELRDQFYEGLNQLVDQTSMEIFASVIDKNKLTKRYTSPANPYEIALLFCMERLLKKLLDFGQQGRLVHVMFESRGKRENAELELEFRRICSNQSNWGYKAPDFTEVRFEPVFVSKAANSTGLQLADLVARPIALNCLRPGQPNRAFEVIEPKLSELKVFP